jgi:hypothetical protein
MNCADDAQVVQNASCSRQIFLILQCESAQRVLQVALPPAFLSR